MRVAGDMLSNASNAAATLRGEEKLFSETLVSVPLGNAASPPPPPPPPPPPLPAEATGAPPGLLPEKFLSHGFARGLGASAEAAAARAGVGVAMGLLEKRHVGIEV